MEKGFSQQTLLIIIVVAEKRPLSVSERISIMGVEGPLDEKRQSVCDIRRLKIKQQIQYKKLKKHGGEKLFCGWRPSNLVTLSLSNKSEPVFISHNHQVHQNKSLKEGRCRKDTDMFGCLEHTRCSTILRSEFSYFNLDSPVSNFYVTWTIVLNN